MRQLGTMGDQVHNLWVVKVIVLEMGALIFPVHTFLTSCGGTSTENAIMSETYDRSTCGCDGHSFIDRIIGREFFRPLGACLLPATGCKPVA